MFKRELPDGRSTKLLWVINKLNNNFHSQGDENTSLSLKSSIVQMQDGNCYLFEMRATSQSNLQSKLIVHAIPPPQQC